MDNRKISALELQEMLNKHENVFILDVRPVDQREEWRIAESTHVDAYKRLNAGDNTVLDEVSIPENVPVVAVCAAGYLTIASLNKKGSLEGHLLADLEAGGNYCAIGQTTSA